VKFSHFFIDRPIFAAVIAVFIALVGVFAYPLLPLAQYPEIAPPSIYVSASFPGASAETLAETVAAPLEQQINGVQGMLYMSSSSANGTATITVTFRPGVNLDTAQVLVQNRVAIAEARLPDQVRQIGITVNKQSAGLLMFVGLTSDDLSTTSINQLGAYANASLRDQLLRVPGVADVSVYGSGLYSMRIWIDPAKAAARNLTATEIVGALRTQNIQTSGGALGQPPFDRPVTNQLPIQVQGRLSTPDQFADVVIRTDTDGRVIRVRDVARVELGVQDYSTRGYFDGKPGVALGIVQQPGSNALDAAKGVLKVVEAAKPDFPPAVSYRVAYNPTEYVAASVKAVQRTLVEAVFLVVIVVLIFLQTWRASIIPILAIPVALVGTFAVQLALGFSINSLSLFALVLAVGIVVDDAIVVVENVERNIRAGMTPREAAYRTMDEVTGALIAIGLVLLAVFVPTAFVSGIPGAFYKQFAVTISAASVISLIISLTLSPALAALLLRPHRPSHDTRNPRWIRVIGGAGERFNRAFQNLSDRYGRLTARLVRASVLVLVVYAGLLLLTGWRLNATPTGFIPEQDQGYLIGILQLPAGASLGRTDDMLKQAIAETGKIPGVKATVAFAGLDASSFSVASNSATMFIMLDDWSKRGKGQTAPDMAKTVMGRMSVLQGANVFVLSPPPVQGLGVGGGFKMMVQDRGNLGYRGLEGAANAMMGAAMKEPEVQGVFSQFNTASPRITAEVDRDKALMLGVQPADVYATLGDYLGSTYINDFTLGGRTFRVTAQAEPSGRDDVADIAALKVRSASGAMVPLGSLTNLVNDTGPVRVVRYNLFPAAELLGQAAPGVSSGEAIKAMEQLARTTLPPGASYEWTDIAYQEKESGNTAGLVFGMAVLLVFLVLAAQYEAFTLPLAVILIVPMCILAAMVGVNLRHQDNNILTQVGLVVLVALAAKNAILIVEFAKQAEERQGQDRFQAAVTAARTRLRPILMTSFAFIFGVIPLMLASGPGQEMRRALGTTVFFGMLGVTGFGLLLTPTFYVVCRWMGLRIPRPPKKDRQYPTSSGGTPHDPLDDDWDGDPS
jgi:hydrophobe/amphiphile efflux-1 (HAE1) family protein